MKWTVILTTHNQVRYTAFALATLREWYPGIPIIVVDNNSKDETETHIRRLVKLGMNIKYLPVDAPRNLARSWNIGLANADTDYVIISNNDVAFFEGCIEAMEAAIRHPQVGVVLPADNDVFLKRARGVVAAPPMEKILEFHQAVDVYAPAQRVSGELLAAFTAWHRGASWQHSLPEMEIIEHPYYPAGGFCFAIDRKKHLERYRAFDEGYEFFGEDWDYFARVQRHAKLVRANKAFVWHFGGRTTGLMDWADHFDAKMRARFQLIEDHEGLREMVSVVIPNYNRVAELRACLESVLNQTYQEFRVYVVDDGSQNKEEIQELIRNLRDERVGLWRLDFNKGPAAARNHGIAHTRGKYIALLDSDDQWLPNHLETHVREHERSFCTMTYSDARFSWRWWDSERRVFVEVADALPSVDYYGEFDRALLEEKNYIITSSTVWWGDTLRALKFDESKRFEEDWDCFLRCPGEVRHLPKTTLIYHQQPGAGNLMEINNAMKTPPSPPSLGPVLEPKITIRSSVVTVVMPTRNRPEELARALSSVGSEVYIIVVDDGSFDFDRVKAVCARYPNVTLLRNEARGASAARNLGVRASETAWVKFLDDDDFLCPCWFTLHEAAFSSADIITVDAAIPRGESVEIVDFQNLFTSMLAVRVGAFEALGGFDELLSAAEERDFFSRALEAKYVHRHLPGVQVVRGRARSTNYFQNISDVKVRSHLERHAEFFAP